MQLPYINKTSFCPSLLGEKAFGTNKSPHGNSTNTVTVSVVEQPFAVTVRVYVVVTVGEATGVGQAVQDKDNGGLHEKVTPVVPLPLRVILFPEIIVTLLPASAVGPPVTGTTVVFVDEHPFESVIVTE